VPGREYEAAGERYRVLDSAAGWTERGVASWYGPDFHGRSTASGEPYDMEALTAAHRVLPLGTAVRVRRADGRGEPVTVRVNDRGPFARGRILDLSRAAARRLGMLEAGTAEVVIEAVGAGRDFSRGDFTLQVGSFASRDNALRLAKELWEREGLSGEVVPFDRGDALFHRVRSGRFATLAEAEAARARLEGRFPDAFVVAR
jgi:rare lipoprotein A